MAPCRTASIVVAAAALLFSPGWALAQTIPAATPMKTIGKPNKPELVDIPRLKLRAAVLNKSVFYSTVCAITALLIIVAFVTALFHVAHEFGVAVLFVVALGFFVLALVNLARETRIALHDFDHHQ